MAVLKCRSRPWPPFSCSGCPCLSAAPNSHCRHGRPTGLGRSNRKRLPACCSFQLLFCFFSSRHRWINFLILPARLAYPAGFMCTESVINSQAACTDLATPAAYKDIMQSLFNQPCPHLLSERSQPFQLSLTLCLSFLWTQCHVHCTMPHAD